MRTDLSTVVTKQLPEFIREDYPTFVAFVQAYYDWLKQQEIDLVEARDVDKTLDDYLKYFKKELSVHLPRIQEDDRLVLPRMKELYLAKGSLSSFKLLFRLLYSKDVEVTYPGQQMLKASDGTWNQEISIFAKVDYGDPDEIVGRLVDIVSAGRAIRVLVDRKEALTGEVERIINVGNGIYEFFLDKRFFGNINVGDKIKYKDIFQAEILPATQKPIVLQAGKGFRVGQVFSINSGGGTGALLKITQVDSVGGIKYCELIKFGIGYTSDFGYQIVSNNSINNKIVNDSTTTTTIAGNVLSIHESTLGFDEQGYISYADYVDYLYADASYAGTVAREFSLNYRNTNIVADNPAQVRINLGALVRYPGYYTSNNGFLDDSIKIQDSFYYQKFSYVVKIDKRLDDYKAAVRALLHPAGMKLFGEYNITNNFDLSIALECIVKYLNITVYDVIDEEDLQERFYYTLNKALYDSSIASESISTIGVTKIMDSEGGTPYYLYGGTVLGSDKATATESATLQFSKVVTDTNTVTPTETTRYFGLASDANAGIGKALGSQLMYGNSTYENTSVTMTETSFYFGLASDATAGIGKRLDDSQSVPDTYQLNISKALADSSIGTLSNNGEIWMGSYQGQDYFATTNYVEGFVQAFTN